MTPAQPSTQVGPLSSGGLKWYKKLRHHTFGHALRRPPSLRELGSLVVKVEAHRLERTAVKISVLPGRLLASNLTYAGESSSLMR